MRTARPGMLVAASLVAVFAVLAVLPPRSFAVDFELRSAPEGEPSTLIGIGQSFSANVIVRNDSAAEDAGIQGFQLALGHDSALLRFVQIGWEGTDLDVVELNGRLGPAFYLVNQNPAAAGGVTVGVVLQEQALGFLLRQGDHLVSRAQYRALRATVNGPTTVGFAASLGDPPIETKYTTRAGQTVAPAATRGLEVTVAPVTYSIHFTADRFRVDSGADVTVPIELENAPQAVHGFSFGVKHDAALLTVKEVRGGADLTAVTGPLDSDRFEENAPFFALNTSPAGGDGFTVAVILNSSDASKALDPAESPHRIFDVVYTAAAANGEASVEITGDLGDPPVAVVLDLLGVSQEPVPPEPAPPTSAAVAVGDVTGVGAPFIRGDVDQGGSVNITDATSILAFLFNIDGIQNPGVLDTIENCLIVLNVDASLSGGQERASSVNLTDAINLLQFLFQGGARPPPPFGACGQPVTAVADDFLCRSFNCR